MTDADLVEHARAGDTAAFRELVERHQQLAFRVAYLATGWRDVDDIVQEAFVRAYLMLDRLRAGESFRPWLLSIVANEARNRSRGERRREAATLRLAQAARPHLAPSPEEALVTRREREALLQAFASLREDDRHVISCRYFLELSEAETAQALQCPPGTVKSRLSRALTRLRGELVEVAG